MLISSKGLIELIEDYDLENSSPFPVPPLHTVSVLVERQKILSFLPITDQSEDKIFLGQSSYKSQELNKKLNCGN